MGATRGSEGQNLSTNITDDESLPINFFHFHTPIKTFPSISTVVACSSKCVSSKYNVVCINVAV